MIYYFLVKSKPPERIGLLITTSVNIYQTKKNPIVMKTCFSEVKLMKQFGNPPISKRTPLSTNPPISEMFFFMTPLIVQISKTRNLPLFLGGRKLCNHMFISV